MQKFVAVVTTNQPVAFARDGVILAPRKSPNAASICTRNGKRVPEIIGCGALLAQNAEQPELERRGLVEEIPVDQGTVPSTATQAASPLWALQARPHRVSLAIRLDNTLLSQFISEPRWPKRFAP